MKEHDPLKYESYLKKRREWSKRKYDADHAYRVSVRAGARDRYARERSEGIDRGRKWYQNSDPAKRMLRSARSRAKKKGMECSLLLEDISIPTHCPVLGVMLTSTPGSHYNRDYSPSLDRIDNNLGYMKGNVIVVSHRANSIKSNATIAELRKIADFYEPLEF